MKIKDRIEILEKYVSVKSKDIYEYSLDSQSLTFLNIRDVLIELGTILEEDLENNIYVALIPAGIANKNDATVLVQMTDGKIDIISYAKEGIIKQNTAKKAVINLEKCLEKKKV